MAIETGPRHELGRDVKRSRTTAQPQKSDHTDGATAMNELDTRADTICCGANWRILEPTGLCCDVRGFHESFDAIKDIPIASAATAITDENGVTYILVVNEALYFGSTLDHSLINPNQIRHYGIPVSDDPYDPNRELGIDHEELFVPFQTRGATICFESRVPTTHELDQCTYIVLTDDAIEWDPNQIQMNNNRPYGDRHVTINQVKMENERRRDLPIEHESDLCLGSISRSLVPDLLYERLISSVKVEYKPSEKKEPKIKKLRRRADISKARAKRPTRSRRRLHEVKANDRHSKITPEHLAKLMNIGIDKAKQMLKVTTQKGVRTAVHPITRRYRVDHLNLHSSKLAGQWYVDWISAGTKSLAQNIGAFVFTNGTFTEVYPAESNKQAPANMSLNDFCNDVGEPHKLKSDRAPEFCGRSTQFLHNAKKRGIDLTYSEPDRKNQISPLDVEVREIRKRTHNKLKTKNAPRRVWDYCLAHQSKMRQFLPRNQLGGRSAFEHVTGKTPDISEYLDFDFYDLVWYHPGVHPNFNNEIRELGRWLGVSHRVGSDMCYWILTVTGDVISESTVQHVTRDDTLDPNISQQIEDFNERVDDRLDDTNFKLSNDEGGFTLVDEYDLPQWDSAYGDNITTPTDAEYGGNPDDVPMKDIDDIEPETYDKYIGAKIILNEDQNNGGNIATIKRRATDDYGRPIGQAHMNPLFDTREFEVELENGESERLMANQIAMNLYSQLDDEGREILTFSAIVDHKSDGTALTKDNGYIELSNGHRKPKQTTRGWKVLVEFKDDTTEWIDMKDVKEANPVDLAEYAVLNNIEDEPAFAWWVPYVFKKRDRIIAKTKTKYWRTTHKYGVRLPKNAADALRIDMETGTDFWAKAINKEMAKAKVSYEEVEGCMPEQARHGQVPELTGFQEIKCHLIFDVKMDFTRKARFVAGGHMTNTPVGICYSSVVSRESVRIAFTIAALNDLDIMSCDIGNAYLNAPCREKIWFEAGIECGQSMKGKVMKLVRALYGLKSSGASWRHMFKTFIEQHLGFTPSLIDPDLYYRRQSRPDGDDYYELLLVYVDDVLACSHDPEAIMKSIGQKFEIKNDEYGTPTQYLGADVQKLQAEDGSIVWALSSESYIKGAIDTVQRLLAEDGRQLKSGKRNHKGPLPPGYKPELDTTPELKADYVSRYQQLIGILRWAVELGRIDIQIEVAIMSQYQMNPREGHIEALYLIFHYLWKHPKKRLVMDPAIPNIDQTAFNNTDLKAWETFYGDVEEAMPPRMPEPLGPPVYTGGFVDSDHASNVITRRSHTGIMIFLMSALMSSFSKKQNTVESSTYGSELVALRIARDQIVAMRIKLRSIGVNVESATDVFCDNMGVVKNTSVPESTLSKKHNSINYHVIREAAAAGILRVGKEDTMTNKADAMTKLIPYSRKIDLLGSTLLPY